MNDWPSDAMRLVEPSVTQETLRVLVASHSHPEVSHGGAEVSAFAIFRGLQATPGCAAWFLGCNRNIGAHRTGVMLSQPYSDAEYLYATGEFDWFNFANRDPRFRAEIERLFIKLKPDVVHFHHYINFGVEIFLHLKRVLPACKIVLTLHEYLAICRNYGQMVTTAHRGLCYQATPARCHECFPNHDRSDFFLRKLYIDRFLDLVDVFIAPSNFLAERYVQWGIPAAKMTVLENLMPVTPPRVTMSPPADGMLRLGFFGQLSALKGIDVIFDAAEFFCQTQNGQMNKVSFEIHGDYRGQPTEFQEAFLARLQNAGSNVRFHGPYEQARVNQLMQSMHAILVPSIWWENSPVVIQEALRNKRPVICSDIGGMAEKVRLGLDGFHFAAGNAGALIAMIQRLLKNPDELAAMTAAMTGAPAIVATMQDYLDVYRAA